MSLTLLEDMVQNVAEEMDRTLLRVDGYGEREINEKLSKLQNADYPAILHAIRQTGTLEVRYNKKAYIEYSPAELIFVAPNLDLSEGTGVAVIRDLVQLATQFCQRLIYQEAWQRVTTNNTTFTPSMDYGFLKGDSSVVFVALQFPLKIDPSIPTVCP